MAKDAEVTELIPEFKEDRAITEQPQDSGQLDHPERQGETALICCGFESAFTNDGYTDK